MSAPSSTSTIFCCKHATLVTDAQSFKFHYDPNRELHDATFKSFLEFADRRQIASDVFCRITMGIEPQSSGPSRVESSSPQEPADFDDEEALKNNPLTNKTPFVFHLASRHDFGPAYSHRYFICPSNLKDDWKEANKMQWFAEGHPFKMTAQKWDLKCMGDGKFFRLNLRPNLDMRGCYPVLRGGIPTVGSSPVEARQRPESFVRADLNQSNPFSPPRPQPDFASTSQQKPAEFTPWSMQQAELKLLQALREMKPANRWTPQKDLTDTTPRVPAHASPWNTKQSGSNYVSLPVQTFPRPLTQQELADTTPRVPVHVSPWNTKQSVPDYVSLLAKSTVPPLTQQGPYFGGSNVAESPVSWATRKAAFTVPQPQVSDSFLSWDANPFVPPTSDAAQPPAPAQMGSPWKVPATTPVEDTQALRSIQNILAWGGQRQLSPTELQGLRTQAKIVCSPASSLSSSSSLETEIIGWRGQQKSTPAELQGLHTPAKTASSSSSSSASFATQLPPLSSVGSVRKAEAEPVSESAAAWAVWNARFT